MPLTLCMRYSPTIPSRTPIVRNIKTAHHANDYGCCLTDIIKFCYYNYRLSLLSPRIEEWFHSRGH
ncbi:hypothetical protein GBAR_LOCUS24153 [Geodia barretti]|uniref:Uncharacterized protein n=1 Tax=Geodia barretti TaxID=519541 RepID=A0AA35T944_GEOBA|nr:hypothetical protein GBAR_LOCUS24153 [Geodia barretti]